MTPAQCRAARERANLSIVELAAAASVSVASVCDFESGIAPHLRNAAEIEAMQAALERAGVEFTKGGVRARKNAEKEAAERPAGAKLKLKRGGGDVD
jgi:predicted transcriptional regulator